MQCTYFCRNRSYNPVNFLSLMPLFLGCVRLFFLLPSFLLSGPKTTKLAKCKNICSLESLFPELFFFPRWCEVPRDPRSRPLFSSHRVQHGGHEQPASSFPSAGRLAQRRVRRVALLLLLRVGPGRRAGVRGHVPAEAGRARAL